MISLTEGISIISLKNTIVVSIAMTGLSFKLLISIINIYRLTINEMVINDILRADWCRQQETGSKHARWHCNSFHCCV